MERLARVGGHVLTRTAAAAAQPPLETEDALLDQMTAPDGDPHHLITAPAP